MADTKITVGCAGAGTLGAAIMHRLVDRGFHVRVWNRSRDKLKPLVEAGATGAAMPVTSLVEQLHRKLVSDGLGDADNTEFVRMYREQG